MLAIEILNNGLCFDKNKKVTKNIEEVVEINLSGNDNKKLKYIPSELSLFKNLKILNLSNNEISKIENLHFLPKLEYINLMFNNIESIDGLGNNKELKVLFLNNNKIKSDMKGLKNNSKLEYLNLTLNQNIKFNVNDIDGLINLKEFYFSENLLLNNNETDIEKFLNSKKLYQQTLVNILHHIISLNKNEMNNIKDLILNYIDINKLNKLNADSIIDLLTDSLLEKSKNNPDFEKKLLEQLNNRLKETLEKEPKEKSILENYFHNEEDNIEESYLHRKLHKLNDLVKSNTVIENSNKNSIIYDTEYLTYQ